MVKRKYALSRIKAGDYLLPSNDRKTIWRIAQYEEDGNAQYNDGTKLIGRFWGAWKYIGRDSDTINLQEWSDFNMLGSLFRSRTEAIKFAMNESEPKQPPKQTVHDLCAHTFAVGGVCLQCTRVIGDITLRGFGAPMEPHSS